MANSSTSIRLHLFLLLVLLSSALTLPSDELNTSSTSPKNLFTRLSRRNPPIREISYPSGNNRNHVGSNQSIKPASKKKSKKKHKKKPKKKPHYHKQKPSMSYVHSNPASGYSSVRAPVPAPATAHAPVIAPAPAAIPAAIPHPPPAPVSAHAPTLATIPAPISQAIPASIPAAIPDIVSSTTKALKPAQPNSQPHSTPAEPSNTDPQSPPPVLNLHPSLPTYGAPSDEGSDIDRWVNGHNKVRRMYTVGDVTWSPKLAAAALQHSQTCYFKHTSNNQYGENIAAGQQSIEQVMKEWVFGQGERDSYVRSDPTSHSHYTQVVWADTKQIGCALTTCDQFGGASLGPGPIKFWVCEYDPPGNVMGWSAKEVHAATGGAPLSGYASKFRHKRRHEFSSKH